MSLTCKKFLALSLILLLTPALILGAYFGSILWRVSLAEVELFGSSKLIPIKTNQIYFPGPRDESTFYNNTYWFNRNDEKVLVWTDKINCFQHVYGSALAAYELGSNPAHLLFCANEFAEFTFDWNGITFEDLMDRRKDLAHNAIGRELAQVVKKQRLKGHEADTKLKELVLNEIEAGKNVYLSYLDRRVAVLPMESELGCPGLPMRNIFNSVDDGIDIFKSLRRQIKQKIAAVKNIKI